MVRIDEFNAENYEPNEGKPDPAPPGWYACTIFHTSSERTHDGTGQYLQVKLRPIESVHPKQKDQVFYDNLNLWNSSAQAVEIAHKTLSQICRCVKVMRTSETEELHNKPIAVKVKVRPAQTVGDKTYDARNEVIGYDAYETRFGSGAPVSRETNTPPTAPPPQGHAPAAPTAVQPPPQGQPGQAGKAPW